MLQKLSKNCTREYKITMTRNLYIIGEKNLKFPLSWVKIPQKQLKDGKLKRCDNFEKYQV